jgi:hypothetical protein
MQPKSESLMMIGEIKIPQPKRRNTGDVVLPSKPVQIAAFKLENQTFVYGNAAPVN